MNTWQHNFVIWTTLFRNPTLGTLLIQVTASQLIALWYIFVLFSCLFLGLQSRRLPTGILTDKSVHILFPYKLHDQPIDEKVVFKLSIGGIAVNLYVFYASPLYVTELVSRLDRLFSRWKIPRHALNRRRAGWTEEPLRTWRKIEKFHRLAGIELRSSSLKIITVQTELDLMNV
jgi:hypothetical protein